MRTAVIAFSILAFFCEAIAQAQKSEGDWGSVGAGYIYQFTELTNSQWTTNQGWYVLPTFNITRQVGVFADFANFYAKRQNFHVEL